MSKKPIKQDDEWGNIELPGLSDEELFTKNWNVVAANRDKAKDPKWIEAQKEGNAVRWLDPEFRKKNKERYQDPELAEKIRIKNQTLAKDPTWLEKMKSINENKRKDPAHIERHQTAVDIRTKDPDWQKTVKRKSIQTPDGIFESRVAAAKFYNVKPPVINFRLKKYPDQYYYIKD